MSSIRQEGAESPEVSLESQRRAMLHSAVRTGHNSLFNYFGFDTLDAEGLQERGIAYPQPQMPIVPNIAQVAPTVQPQIQHHVERRPMQPQYHTEQPEVAQIAPQPTLSTSPALTPVLTPEAPIYESPHMTDARAKVEAAFAEIQLEAQQAQVQPAEQPMNRREDYDLAA